MNKMPPHLQKGFKDDPRVGRWEDLTTTLQLEHHSMRASDVGLNVDRRVWQRHRLTCSPLRINRYEVPHIDDTNATVFWIGYEEGSYDASETYGNVIPAHCLTTNDYTTRSRYGADGFLQRSWYPDGPWEVQSRRLYELAIYPALADGPQQMQFVNLHHGLNASNGDTLVTMLRHGMELLTGVSPMYQPGLETPFEKPSFRWGQPMDYAVGCIEAYSLCYDHSCTQWLGIESALETVKYHLGLEYGNNTASELTPVYKLMAQASSLRNVLTYHHHSTLVLRSLLQRVPGLERALSQMPQWQWEVRAWFELSMFMFRLNLMASIKGETRGPEKPSPSYNGTEWICEKLLFQDDHVTNLDIFSLSIALCSLMTVYLLSYLRELLAFAARSSSVARLYRRLGFVGGSITALLLLAQRSPLAFSFIGARRSSVARRDIGFVNEIPSSNSIVLEHVARSNESRQEPSSL
jgi:hypothetical protein